MAGTVKVAVDGGLATVRMGRAHGNAIDPGLATDLAGAFQKASLDPDVRGVLLAAAGKLFSPGLDVQDLFGLDRAEMGQFMADFHRTLFTMFAFPKPMVAAIHGHAIAGGCVISLTADWRVLAEGKLIGLNEIRVGVPLPYGVTQILREVISAPHITEVALAGRNYKGTEALAPGLAHEVYPPEGFEEHCLQRLDDLASRDLRAYSATKRYFRSAAVERVVGREDKLREEFLDSWFSPETRKRMQGIVDQLTAG
jgi:enoyl-CoA hydratase/carnithine racemase